MGSEDKNKRVPDIDVNVDKMVIGDIDGNIVGRGIATFKPLGYDVMVGISQFALIKILKWAVRQRYIILNGELWYKSTHRTERISRNGK